MDEHDELNSQATSRLTPDDRRPNAPSRNDGQGTADGRRRLRRRQDQGPRRARGRPQAPGMYIGSTGAAGLHHLVYEVVDNSIDEALAGFCDQVDVTIHIDNSVTVVDNGRGIPVDHARERQVGGRSRADRAARRRQVRQRRLQGLGRPARRRRLGRQRALRVAASSRSGATARSTSRATSAACRPATLEITGTTEAPGTKITFKPDAQIFETTEFSFDTLAQRLRELAFLNGGILITHRRRARRQEPRVPVRGRHRRVRRAPEQEQGGASTRSRSSCRATKDGIDVEIALQWNDGYAENDLHLREQHQHARRRHAPRRASGPRSPARSTTTRERTAWRRT